MTSAIDHIKSKGFIISAISGMLMLLATGVRGQERLPHPIIVTVVTTQGLNFGAFTEGSIGGTIVMSPLGTRTTTGDVVALGLGYTSSAALFQISADPGTVINVLNGPDVLLSGSGGGTLSLHLGASNPAAPMITTAVPPAKTNLTIGGTLTVGVPSANPPGNYNGVFYITVIKE